MQQLYRKVYFCHGVCVSCLFVCLFFHDLYNIRDLNLYVMNTFYMRWLWLTNGTKNTGLSRCGIKFIQPHLLHAAPNTQPGTRKCKCFQNFLISTLFHTVHFSGTKKKKLVPYTYSKQVPSNSGSAICRPNANVRRGLIRLHATCSQK